MPSVQLLDFESLGPLIRHASLVYGFCSLGQWFAIDFLQNLPRDKPLVFRLEVPAAGPSEVFHLLVLRHAGRTDRVGGGDFSPQPPTPPDVRVTYHGGSTKQGFLGSEALRYFEKRQESVFS